MVITPTSGEIPLHQIASEMDARASASSGPERDGSNMRPSLCGTVALSGVWGFDEDGGVGVVYGVADGFIHDPEGLEGMGAGLPSLERRWTALLRRFSPVAVLAVSGAGSAPGVGPLGPGGWRAGGDEEMHRAARRACGNAEVTPLLRASRFCFFFMYCAVVVLLFCYFFVLFCFVPLT